MDKSQKGLSAFHLAMMALGTVIGGSFFLGSVVAIKAAGPAVIISYILGGILVYFILYALSEMIVADPEAGSFRTFSEKAYGPGLGFVTGWVYWTGIVLAMSSEAVAISILLRTWLPGASLAVIGASVISVITLLNLLGAKKLSKLESSLVSIKLLAIIGFIILAALLILGLIKGVPKIGIGALGREAWFPAGISGIAGSMLIVMFCYAGFEIIGLAAAETREPQKTVPKAIAYTVISLASLFIISIFVLLPLIPVNRFTTDRSPMVLALINWKLTWVGWVMNVVMVTAIFSTMLAAVFGLGRMMRSLADAGQAPVFLKDRGEIPYRGIIFSGASMLAGLFFSFILPNQVYIFLVSSGGFSLLFTYLIILISHLKLRKLYGCPPEGKCQLPGYPYSSWIAIISLVSVILSMPLVPGQGYGLLAGVILTLLYTVIYFIKSYISKRSNTIGTRKEENYLRSLKPQSMMEASEDLTPDKSKKEIDKNDTEK